MKHRLLTVGDSFTYGDELSNPYEAWPYKLASLTNSDVVNLGESGIGNTKIIRKTIVELVRDSVEPYDLVVIGWSSAGRVEWKDNIGSEYSLWPGYSGRSSFFHDHPWRAEWLNYMNQYHDPSYLYQQYLLNVLSLQSYLKVKNINYVMLNIVNNEYYRISCLPELEYLATEIDKKHFLGWDQFGMAEIADGCPRGSGGHPLEQGHIKIANKIYEHIRNFGWIS